MNITKKLLIPVFVLLLFTALAIPIYAIGGEPDTSGEANMSETAISNEYSDGFMKTKTTVAGLTIAIASVGGALAIAAVGWKAINGIARQPEANDKITGALMLSLVFIETALIYALLVVILIIFVL